MRLTPSYLFVALAFISSASLAQVPSSDTLKKIKDSGTIVVGHRDASIPFSYLDNHQQPVGYSMDIAKAITEAVKKKLNQPSLAVKYRLITSQNRISLVQNGTIDFECGSTTNNRERQTQVAFSNAIFEAGTRILTRKNAGIRDFVDLAGKNVVTTGSTTAETALKKMNAKVNFNLLTAKDHGESFMLLESGRAAAFVLDDVLLYGELAKAKTPSDWVVTGKAQSFEVYGCMLRKNDPAFKQVVDGALVSLYKSGEIQKIYQKWFMQPIPPKGINLNFPMSDEFKELISSPTDKPSEML